MPQHHRPVSLRASIARIAIAGAASLATVAATAHVAVADEVTPTDETTETPSTTSDSPTPDAPETTAAPTPPAPAKTDAPPAAKAEAPVERNGVEPDYGWQKFRVGVQLADGAYAPDASTVGSEITITVFNEDDDFEDQATCLTAASTVKADSTASYCLEEDLLSYADGAARASVEADDDIPNEQSIELPPGWTALIEQTGGTEGLIADPEGAIIEPCEVFIYDECEDAHTVMFDELGPPPVAKGDSITATSGEPVTIKVLSNDDNGNGAPTEVEVATSPKNGTTVVGDTSGASGASTTSVESGVAYVTTALASSSTSRTAFAAAAAGSQFITYTPTAGFVGTDSFTYRLTTGNGSDTATVSIKVLSADGVLPDTGSPNTGLLGYAALLLGGGGWLVARGRRETARVALAS